MAKKSDLAKPVESNKLAIFEDSEIRRIQVGDEWYYSVVDVVAALTSSSNPRNYWSTLKKRELKHGIELSTNCVQLKLLANDGKKYLTDCADNEGILRIIQSVPSKKAEPFKRWLAKVGAERIDEIEQPAKAIERAKGYYLQKGYSPEWVQTRIAGIDTRISFTDSLKERGIKPGFEYAVLTNEMYKSWSGFTAKEYKVHKGLTSKESLRDNMTPMELATTLFSETAARELIDKSEAQGFVETQNQIHIAGKITKEALEKIEIETGKKVVTHKNMKELNSATKQKAIIQSSENKKLKK
ncbi:MAG: Bro-N domain-containing protein [Cytophagia bacterium]|nr:Bro-N domain-containing protein [Cytophagia bacterium]